MSTMNTLIADLEAIPLADMTERDQLTFAAAIGHLRRLSDRVHTLEISQHRTAEKIDELERENAELRELRRVSFMQMLAVLRQCSDRLEIFNSSFCDIDPFSDTIVQYRSDANDSFVLERRAALAGSEKP